MYHTYHLQLSDDPEARIACYVHHSPAVGPYPVLALGTAVIMPTRGQLEELHRQVGDYLALDRAAPACDDIAGIKSAGIRMDPPEPIWDSHQLEF